MTIIKDIIKVLEKWAPIEYAENFDNIGLLVGNKKNKLKNILITIDLTEKVIYEALKKKCNLIITFHPIFFKGIKKITGSNNEEKCVILLIKNDISVYCIHTNLDNIWNGSNYELCKKLGLKRISTLLPKKKILKKLVTYVPLKYANKIRNILFNIGAGELGNYINCSYNFNGFGTFNANNNSNPFCGEKKNLNFEKETCISVIFPYYKQNIIEKTLLKHHPYEQVPYEIFTIDNVSENIGMGLISELSEYISEIDFLTLLKKKINISYIKHSKFLNKKVKKIAILTGSGGFAISKIKNKNIDVFISSDIKYHDFMKVNKSFLIVDIGHYESEKFNKNLLHNFLKKKFINFTIIKSEINTNPVYYI